MLLSAGVCVLPAASGKRNYFPIRLFRAAAIFNCLVYRVWVMGYGLGLGFLVVITIIVSLTLTLTLITTLTVILP